MGHNGCDGSQASGPWAIGSGYRFTCCFGLGFQLQNLQDFMKISRALIKDIFLGVPLGLRRVPSVGPRIGASPCSRSPCHHSRPCCLT